MQIHCVQPIGWRELLECHREALRNRSRTLATRVHLGGDDNGTGWHKPTPSQPHDAELWRRNGEIA